MSDVQHEPEEHEPGEHNESEEQYGFDIPSEVRTWAMLCHLSALLAIPLAVSFGHILAPLIIWLLKRQEHPFIDHQGKESLNFQISLTIYSVVISPLACFLVGIPLLIGLWVANIVLVIMASIKANNGIPYRYPLCIRLVK